MMGHMNGMEWIAPEIDFPMTTVHVLIFKQMFDDICDLLQLTK